MPTSIDLSSVTDILSISSIHLVILLSCICLLSIYALRQRTSKVNNDVQYLPETIPYISNTILFMTDAAAFQARVNKHFSNTKCTIIKCYIGFRPCYHVAGTANVQRLFGTPDTLDGNFLHYILMEKLWGMTKLELKKFRQDNSGRVQKPAAGSEGLPPDSRYWRNHGRLYTDFLTDPKYGEVLAAEFSKRFVKRLEHQCNNEGWASTSVLGLLKKHMFESATETLFGTKLFDLNPSLTDCYWEFDVAMGKLVTAPFDFLQPHANSSKNRLHAMVRRHIDFAWDNFDFDGADAECVWEPNFGSRLSRESALWLRANGFQEHTIAGHTLATLIGLNGNTVPMTAWALNELLQDRELLAAVRSEIQAQATNLETGELDPRSVVNLPLLQSIYVETMRLHVSFSVVREVRNQPFELAPGCWAEPGAIAQTNSVIAQLEEEVWGVEEHPASEFWAWRHTRTEEVRDTLTGDIKSQVRFAMRGRPTSFFPYGGGHWVCPGRHFAKMQIMLALALIVTKFDLEFIRWTRLDGTESDRPAKNDSRYEGVIGMLPDRDLVFRWRKAL